MSHGRFVWNELRTTDVDAAKAFYTELFNWTTSPMDMGPAGTYHLINDGHQQTGGIMASPAGHAMPSHWMGYLEVDSVDETVEQVKKLGGTVTVPPFDADTIGRFAFVADDQGVNVALITSLEPPPEPEGRPKTSQFCWYTIAAPDIQKAITFWSAAMRWECKEVELGGAKQHVFHRGEAQTCGLMALEDGNPAPPHLALAVAVDSVKESFERATKMGATPLMPPTAIGEMGTVAVFADPTGATLSIFEPNDAVMG